MHLIIYNYLILLNIATRSALRLQHPLKQNSDTRKPNSETEMCLFWSINNPPDILEGTKSIEAINREFGITINEDEAVEMYDMNLNDASEYIRNLITDS
jgi:hypothetical protein